MKDEQKYLNLAVKVAKEGGIIFKKFFGKPKSIKSKNGNPRDHVTEVDLKLEKLIRSKIQKSFPTHKIIGEEFGSQTLDKNDLIWIIDPIDGTNNFIQGIPICCISIALWDSNGPLIGVVFNPITNQLCTAVRGQGAYLNSKKIKCSTHSELIQAFGGYGWGRNLAGASISFPKLIKMLHKMRTLGSSTSELAFVAQGVYDFHIQADINVWDYAASVLLIIESGGKVTDWQGNNVNLTTKNLLASNGRLHPLLLAGLKTANLV